MSSKNQILGKRKRSFSPDSTELYFVYESKRRVLWSNLKFNEINDDYTITKKNTGSNDLKSLFKICLTLIAKNIEYVENFIDFPSQIGHVIFKECVEIGRFSFNETTCKKEEQSLKLFAQAYPDLMAKSLNLNSNPILFSYLSNVMRLCCMTFLNLSNCDLMENNLNLNEILKNSMPSLEVLSLSNNNLDHEFVKKLTLSQRLKLSDFSSLRMVDLTGNFKLQPVYLKYFSNYKNLSEIFLSVDRLKEYKSSNHDEFCICSCGFKDFGEIINEGWLEKVIKNNLNMSYQIRSCAVKGKSDKMIVSFFS
jgi:hypothetical protein